ncbi:MAG: peptidylprolyl isomerase [Deltaproteobacteria bacterium]|nr:peptidylprolyl isomerase [Deltaproteobacteria bacterium]
MPAITRCSFAVVAAPEFPSPKQLIPGDGELVAVLHTSMGDISVRLHEDFAPNTVANFVGLSTGSQAWTDPRTGEPGEGPLYRDVVFHRVIEQFMIQGGDPTGTGRGGPGYRFGDECHASATHHGAGVLSMANSGADSNGSQFFITLRATAHLDGRHTVFGEVVEGMDVVDAIGKVATDRGDRPVTPVTIASIDVARR